MKRLNKTLVLFLLIVLMPFAYPNQTHAMSIYYLNQEGRHSMTVGYMNHSYTLDGDLTDWDNPRLVDTVFSYTTVQDVSADFSMAIGFNEVYIGAVIRDDTEVTTSDTTLNGMDFSRFWIDRDNSLSLTNGDIAVTIFRNQSIFMEYYNAADNNFVRSNEFSGVVVSNSEQWVIELKLLILLDSDFNLGWDYQNAVAPDDYEIDAGFNTGVATSITITNDFTLTTEVKIKAITGIVDGNRILPILTTYPNIALNITLVATSSVTAPVNASMNFTIPENVLIVIPEAYQEVLSKIQNNGLTMITWDIGLIYNNEIKQAFMEMSFPSTGQYVFSQINLSWVYPNKTHGSIVTGTSEKITVISQTDTSNNGQTSTTPSNTDTGITNIYTIPEKSSANLTSNTSETLNKITQYLLMGLGAAITTIIYGYIIYRKKS